MKVGYTTIYVKAWTRFTRLFAKAFGLKFASYMNQVTVSLKQVKPQ
jgi:hypothetical protein